MQANTHIYAYFVVFLFKNRPKIMEFSKIRSKIAREAKYGNIWQYTSVLAQNSNTQQESAQSTAKSSSTQAKTSQNHQTRQKLGSKAGIATKKHQNR